MGVNIFSDRTLDLELNLVNVNAPQVHWSGTTTRKLGLVEPSGTLDLTVEAIPHDTGLQVLLNSCQRVM